MSSISVRIDSHPAHDDAAFPAIRPELRDMSDTDLLRACMRSYPVPSLAAWRAAELRALRGMTMPPPVLELGCGNGLFASLLFRRIEHGIDLNPRAVAECRRKSTIYGRQHCMDAKRLSFPAGSFGSVFANCVIEHIPGLDAVLAESRRVLRDGGRMIATVPLSNMNRNLLFPGRRYSDLRARQLQHVNLLTLAEWTDSFLRAGFGKVNSYPYLSGKFCRSWDHVDAPMCLGAGRVNVGGIYSRLTEALPAGCKNALQRYWVRHFASAMSTDAAVDPSAVLIEAIA